jgi:hypothetical protein
MLLYVVADLFKPRKGYQNTQTDLSPDTSQQGCTARGLGCSSAETCIPDRSELTVTSLRGSSCNLDRGDPPPTPPEEKVKLFRSVTDITVANQGLVQWSCRKYIENALSHAEDWKVCSADVPDSFFRFCISWTFMFNYWKYTSVVQINECHSHLKM